MSFVKKIFEEQLEQPLKDVIIFTTKRLTEIERARLLVLIAKEMKVDPDKLVTISVDWR